MPPAVVLAGAVAAGFVQGVSGFGFALVAAVFWTGALPPAVATPLVVIGSLTGQAQAIRGVLPHLDPRLAWPMAAGGLLGLPLGIALLPWVDAPTLRLAVGGLLCAYCPVMLAMRSLPAIAWGGRWADATVGAVGGVLGGLAGLSGPAPTVWCGLRGWPLPTQRAVFQCFLLVVQAAGLLGYLLAGLLTAEVGRLALWLTPIVVAASFAGSVVYARLNGAVFRRFVLALLLLTGIVLVAEAAIGRL